MPLISVVVPMYNVERYLGECLQSIADQTFGDLEVVMVDDGATDGSAAIAAGFAERDSRFRLLSQENGGLSKARNTGLDAATGDFLAFVDSDDALPPRAYELLIGALEETGSDFATGNFHRFTPTGMRTSTFASKAFGRTRLKTHVTEFWPLLADRTAWNKLFRRPFWDENGFRFPEGVLHEDIPVSIPAHFKARSVDVIAEPVYYYRIRAGEGLSITQRRLEQRALLDRLSAVEYVSDFLARDGQREGKRRYDESVVADDLRYYLNVLDGADEAYRELFLDRVNAYLDRANRHIFDPLPAIERLKWHLVRRRLMPELIEVLRFQREDLGSTPAVRVRGRWYGDYPFRTDRRLRIPRSVYQLDEELKVVSEIEDVRLDRGRLAVSGYAYITGIGAPERDTQRIKVTAVRAGRLQRIRVRFPRARFRTRPVRRPDLLPEGRLVSDPAWAGFEATVDTRAFRGLRGWRTGNWSLYVKLDAGRVERRRAQFGANRLRPLRALHLPVPDDLVGKVAPTARTGVSVEISDRWAAIRSHRLLEDDVLEIECETRIAIGSKAKLEVAQSGDGVTHAYPVNAAGEGRFTVRVPLADLLAAPPPARRRTAREDDRDIWRVQLVQGSRRTPLDFPDATARGEWRFGDIQLSLTPTRRGEVALVERRLRPVLERASWTEAAELELAGRIPDALAADELVLVSRKRVEHHRFPLVREPGERFRARATPAATESLAGVLPLAEATWELCVCRAGERDEAEMAPMLADAALYESLPLRTTAAHKPFALGVTGDDLTILVVERDLDDDERGRHHQERLRATAYAARRAEPLRETVVYSSFDGNEYSDSPRAIHEELVRRGAPVEHLWVVRDARAHVPDSATPVRESSREHYEALAHARWVVTNDNLPDWFERRPDQLCIQTWHGTPLQRLGRDVPAIRKATRPLLRRLDQQSANWQYFLSPNRFSTPILRRAYGIEGEMIELGYPRDDALAGPEREARTRLVRDRLGLPEGRRVVLYAPTYREHAAGSRGGYQLELHLDLERLRQAIGHDSVLLFLKHELVSDVVPVADGFVRDVSSYPDRTELLLAADVLVTDYSPVMFDFANTGRPMLFYTYDLDAYQDEIGNFYIDYEATVPGPLLRTTDAVAEAIEAIDAVRAEHADRYSAFASEFCALDDGRAAARVVDRLFER